jgi:hypothetical protein
MIIYGTGQTAGQSETHLAYDAKRNGVKTDMDKAYHARMGQSCRPIKRPFHELDDTISEAVVEFCQDNLNSYIIDRNTVNGV